MKILITGASGFIGSFLVEEALERGFEVWAAVRRSSSRQWLQDERIRFFDLRLDDETALRASLERFRAESGPFDHVIHAAGATKCRHRNDFFRINTVGTDRLARLLMETGTLRGRFVYFSSLSVYGPAREADGLPILETDTPVPDTAYGQSKLQAEQALGRVPGLDYVILRPTGVYGPRERDYFLMAQSIARHVDFSVGFKPQTITFIYVRDLVAAAFLALERGACGRAYFLTDGGEYSSRAFSDLLQQEMGVHRVLHVKAPLWVLRAACGIAGTAAGLFGTTSTLNTDKYHILRQRNWRCDILPAREELGYEPQYPLARGVKEAVAWYRTSGWL
ncbi:MAG: NAD(P)-dependent oxidoreductase [Alloprevotella sp.]|nr:NAD(P)-dependent oxidoreductase [Prevotella sp.]MBR1712765.1 NAD(P)-dependent oxidoreductase [Alloprevotella sp.]